MSGFIEVTKGKPERGFCYSLWRESIRSPAQHQTHQLPLRWRKTESRQGTVFLVWCPQCYRRSIRKSMHVGLTENHFSCEKCGFICMLRLRAAIERKRNPKDEIVGNLTLL